MLIMMQPILDAAAPVNVFALFGLGLLFFLFALSLLVFALVLIIIKIARRNKETTSTTANEQENIPEIQE